MTSVVTPDERNNLDILAADILRILHQSHDSYLIYDCALAPRSTYRMLFYDPQQDHLTELKLKYFAPWKSLTIQTVLFENRRQGTMTKILDLIKSRAKECSIDKIVIESVLSPEMSHCALKNGFQIDPTSGNYIHVKSFFEDSDSKETIFAGNYIYMIGGDSTCLS